MAPHKGLMNRVIREKASTEIYVTLQKIMKRFWNKKGSQQDLRKWIICMVLPTKIGDPPLKMAGRSKNEKVLGSFFCKNFCWLVWLYHTEHL